jgi:hypothetical protein
MKLPTLAVNQVRPSGGVSAAGERRAGGGGGSGLVPMLVGDVFLDLDPGLHPTHYAFQNGTGTCVPSPLSGKGTYCTITPPPGDTTNYDVVLQRGRDYRIGTTSPRPHDHWEFPTHLARYTKGGRGGSEITFYYR